MLHQMLAEAGLQPQRKDCDNQSDKEKKRAFIFSLCRNSVCNGRTKGEAWSARAENMRRFVLGVLDFCYLPFFWLPSGWLLHFLRTWRQKKEYLQVHEACQPWHVPLSAKSITFSYGVLGVYRAEWQEGYLQVHEACKPWHVPLSATIVSLDAVKCKLPPY